MNSTPSFLKERNIGSKEKGITFGFLYPATYDVAMAGMTTVTLANLVNSLPSWRFERVVLPWKPSIEPRSMKHPEEFNENLPKIENLQIVKYDF